VDAHDSHAVVAVAQIVGLGTAAELAVAHLPDLQGRVRRLRDRMEQTGFVKVKLYGNLDGSEYGPQAQRLIAVGHKSTQKKETKTRTGKMSTQE